MAKYKVIWQGSRFVDHHDTSLTPETGELIVEAFSPAEAIQLAKSHKNFPKEFWGFRLDNIDVEPL